MLPDELQPLKSLLAQHCIYRADSLNLIASENIPSPLVESLISEDLQRRYGNYIGIDLQDRHYQGNRYIAEIEEYAHRLGRELFGAAHIDLRPLSGNVAGLAATFGLGQPGNTVLEVDNGHRYAHKLAQSNLRIDLNSLSIPWDSRRSNIDLEATVDLIAEHKPQMLIIGSGIFLFPQPVEALRQALDRHSPGAHLIYDAAHVLGLIAGGRFQNPLAEGADVIVSSTHKTFAGPQGGLILTNQRERAALIGPALAPLIASNHHLGRLPALAATFWEWQTYGAEHAAAIITNAKALGQALDDRGIRLLGADLGFSESHTLILAIGEFGESKAVSDRLESCGIIAGGAGVPDEMGSHGLRMGVQELTRTGMDPEDAGEIADCIAAALQGEEPRQVAMRVKSLAGRFHDMCYTVAPETANQTRSKRNRPSPA